MNWPKEQWGNFAQIASASIALVAIVLSTISLRLSCTATTNSTTTANAAKAQDERRIIEEANATLEPPPKELWSWSEIQGWVTKTRAQLIELSKVGPNDHDRDLHPNYVSLSARLARDWQAAFGDPSPVGVEYCLRQRRLLSLLADAVGVGRIDPSTLMRQLRSELLRFANDVAPRCALALAATTADRVAFSAAYFFATPEMPFGQRPYSIAQLDWDDIKIAGAVEIRRRHPQRPPSERLSAPDLAFSECNGVLANIAYSASPKQIAGNIEFDFQPTWRNAPGIDTNCLMLGETENVLATIDGRQGLREKRVPRRGVDWLTLSFSARGDVEATLYVASHGVPITARRAASSIDWAQPHRLGVQWDVTEIDPEAALVLNVDESKTGGSLLVPDRLGLSDPRASKFEGSAKAERVIVNCGARLRQPASTTPECFRREDGGTFRYGYCQLPGVREWRFGQSLVSISGRPETLDVLADHNCQIAESGVAWRRISPPCRTSPRTGANCLQVLPYGPPKAIEHGTSVAEIMVMGTECVPANCAVFMGDDLEPYE